MEKIWYFAYGSNMRSSVMAARNIYPSATKNVVAPSYILTFDVFGVPYGEPAMASIADICSNHSAVTTPVEPPPMAVHGVAYCLSHEEYLRLVISEGAGIAYREINVEAYLMPSHEDEDVIVDKGKLIIARTLVARYPFRPNAAPSVRYLELLMQGAAEHNLPTGYQHYLKSLPSFDPSAFNASRHRRFGARVFLAFWIPLIGYLMRWVKLRATASLKTSGGASSQEWGWMGGLIRMLFVVMWWYHDIVHAKIFGSGGGIR